MIYFSFPAGMLPVQEYSFVLITPPQVYEFQGSLPYEEVIKEVKEEVPVTQNEKAPRGKDIIVNFQDTERDCDKKVLKKLQKESKKKEKLIQKDEQFLPNEPEIKKKRKTPQNQNRNVIPNIMHQVISFMLKKNRSGHLIQKLIKQMKVQGSSTKRFYTYQSLIKAKINHYVNGDSLLILNELQEPACEIYSEEEQKGYIRICRMLVQYFLSQEFDTQILTSKRMKSDKKLDHLRVKRILLEKFSETLRL